MQSRGLDSSKLGEGKVRDISYEEHIFQKLRARVKALEKKEEKEAEREEALQDEIVNTPLPERVSHSIDRVVTVQLIDSSTSSLPNLLAQVDVPVRTNRAQGVPSLELEGGEGTTSQTDEVLSPAQVEVGRRDPTVEDLQPSDEDPLQNEQDAASSGPARRARKKQQPREPSREGRGTRTGYSLRKKLQKARSKDL